MVNPYLCMPGALGHTIYQPDLREGGEIRETGD